MVGHYAFGVLEDYNPLEVEQIILYSKALGAIDTETSMTRKSTMVQRIRMIVNQIVGLLHVTVQLLVSVSFSAMTFAQGLNRLNRRVEGRKLKMSKTCEM